MNSFDHIADILDLNMDINFNIIKGFSFKDSNLEESYRENYNTGSNFLISSLIVIIGNLATLSYIIFAYFEEVYLALFFTGFFFSLIVFLYTLYKKERKIYFYNSYIQIFIVSSFFLAKGFLLLFYFEKDESEKIEEMLRIIIYHFFSTAIFLLINIESKIFVYLLYFLKNLSLVISCQIIFKKNKFFYLEGVTSFCVFTIFFCIRLLWDYKIRILFAEKKKFEKLYCYAYDHLNGLNGFLINFKNKKSIFYGKKTKNYLDIIGKKKFFEYNSDLNEKDQTLLNRVSDNFLFEYFDIKNSICCEFFKKLKLFDFEKDFKNPNEEILQSEGDNSENQELREESFNQGKIKVFRKEFFLFF